MLAHGFMMASELGLSELEHRALMDVLWGLESGEFVHCEKEEVGVMPVGHAFNMSEWCNTVGCIAGWADRLHGTRLSREYEGRRGLEELFLVGTGRPSGVDFSDITVSQAAAALRNYLTTGRAQWGKVLPRRDERAGVRRGLWGG